MSLMRVFSVYRRLWEGWISAMCRDSASDLHTAQTQWELLMFRLHGLIQGSVKLNIFKISIQKCVQLFLCL